MTNKNNNYNSTSGGIGFCGLLTIVFITLKLLKVIEWSWWWVLAPIWIPFIIFIMVVVGVFFYYNHKSKKSISLDKNENV